MNLVKSGRLPRSGLLVLSFIFFALGAWSDPAPPAARAQQAYAVAAATYEKEPRNPRAAWEFARAAFDLAEFASSHDERARLGEKGEAAAQAALDEDPRSAEAHYYLAMNLGQIARTRGIGALKLVKRMEAEFEKARQLNPELDYAGPDRNLGMLYRDAPRFASVGNRLNAQKHLTRAIELAPLYPENRIALAEGCLKWGDRNCVIRELKALEASLPEAKKKFSGPDWQASWADWDQRLQTLRKEAGETGKALTAPRHG